MLPNALILLLLLLLGACGDGPAPAPPPAEDAEARQIRLTAQLREAMQATDLLKSHALLEELVRDYEGYGRRADGKWANTSELFDAFGAAARDEALRTLNQARPRSEALAWLERARILTKAPMWVMSDEDRVDALVRYASLESLEAAGLGVPDHDGPQIVFFGDHFQLGEAVLESMLRRWQREHGERGLRISVVPLTGRGIRIGLRRRPSESIEHEIEIIHARAKELGLSALPPHPEPDAWLGRFGLETGLSVLIFADVEGRVVAQLCGRILDPTLFEPIVQRLVSR